MDGGATPTTEDVGGGLQGVDGKVSRDDESAHPWYRSLFSLSLTLSLSIALFFYWI
ncbi:hypothetical protein M6B38_356310 [Iris pallida]|uniref:Uncharacterized protein n=1 Tax=Iris pallida TaxID=29817 RepID=A0AAX6GLR6_IRIPA|nr:hypothetical protein M6B38_356310 [Iris pallida]